MPVNQSYPDLDLVDEQWVNVVAAVPALAGKEVTVQALGDPVRVAYTASAVAPIVPDQGHLLLERDHITAQAANVWVRGVGPGASSVAVSGTDPA